MFIRREKRKLIEERQRSRLENYSKMNELNEKCFFKIYLMFSKRSYSYRKLINEIEKIQASTYKNNSEIF